MGGAGGGDEGSARGRGSARAGASTGEGLAAADRAGCGRMATLAAVLGWVRALYLGPPMSSAQSSECELLRTYVVHETCWTYVLVYARVRTEQCIQLVWLMAGKRDKRWRTRGVLRADARLLQEACFLPHTRPPPTLPLRAYRFEL